MERKSPPAMARWTGNFVLVLAIFCMADNLCEARGLRETRGTRSDSTIMILKIVGLVGGGLSTLALIIYACMRSSCCRNDSSAESPMHRSSMVGVSNPTINHPGTISVSQPSEVATTAASQSVYYNKY